MNYFLAVLLTASIAYFAAFPTWPVAAIVVALAFVFGAIQYKEQVQNSELAKKLDAATKLIEENDAAFDDRLNLFVAGLNGELAKINQVVGMIGMNSNTLQKARKANFVKEQGTDG